jgi:hypothetical protein
VSVFRIQSEQRHGLLAARAAAQCNPVLSSFLRIVVRGCMRGYRVQGAELSRKIVQLGIQPFSSRAVRVQFRQHLSGQLSLTGI